MFVDMKYSINKNTVWLFEKRKHSSQTNNII